MKKMIELPKFVSDEEADWWASRAGREYLKLQSAQQLSEGKRAKGSKIIEQLKEKTSVQTAIRLPAADLRQARSIAERKGLGYQTLHKMIVHECLIREEKRL